MRSTIKRFGAAITVLLLIVWVGSGWCGAVGAYTPRVALIAVGGRIEIGWMSPPRWLPEVRYFDPQINKQKPFQWWFEAWQDNFGSGRTYQINWVAIPIWLLALIAGTLTLLIGRRDSRRLPHACRKCGYDLTGLPAERPCPECGTTSTG